MRCYVCQFCNQTKTECTCEEDFAECYAKGESDKNIVCDCGHENYVDCELIPFGRVALFCEECGEEILNLEDCSRR